MVTFHYHFNCDSQCHDAIPEIRVSGLKVCLIGLSVSIFLFLINITGNKLYQNSVNTKRKKNRRSFKGTSRWKKKGKERRTSGLRLIPRYVLIKSL
jgi:hypothetical protein